jgi:hypothetical protein
MILVSYSSIDPLSLSIAKKVKERSSSSNRRCTLSCNAGYIDHDLFKPCGFDFGLMRDFGSLGNFGLGGDMLNNWVWPICELTMTELKEGDKPVFKRVINIEPEDFWAGDFEAIVLLLNGLPS